MLSNKKLTVTLLALLLVIVVISAAASRNQARQSRSAGQPSEVLIEQQKKKQAELEAQFPVADYDAAEAADPTQGTRRRVKNSRYDKRGLVSKDPTPDIIESARILEGYYVPALPSARSDLIIVCDVLASSAHLSNDKTGVYTELTVRVSEVIKNTTRVPLTEGSTITAEREGGVVRYSNGHKRLYHLADEGMPTTGRRYLLFLGSITGSDDYNVLTGYELSQSGVEPVDSSRQFAAYRGYGVDAFLDSVRASLSQTQ